MFLWLVLWTLITWLWSLKLCFFMLDLMCLSSLIIHMICVDYASFWRICRISLSFLRSVFSSWESNRFWIFSRWFCRILDVRESLKRDKYLSSFVCILWKHKLNLEILIFLNEYRNLRCQRCFESHFEQLYSSQVFVLFSSRDLCCKLVA